jgi:N-acetylneuraminate lyase
MIEIKKYKGLVAAPFTPTDPEGNLNPGMIPEYYSISEMNSVSGAFINGFTGKGVSLAQKERQINAISSWSVIFSKNRLTCLMKMSGIL